MSCGKWEGKITIPAGNWTATLREFVPAAVVWTGATNFTATGNDLLRTGADGWDNNDAQGNDTIAGDGYVEAVLSAEAAIGLNDGAASGLSTIDFAFQRSTNGSFKIVENGTPVYTSGNGEYTDGMVARVQRIGGATAGAITYWLDGVLKYTTAGTPVATLTVNAAAYTAGGTIDDAMVADSGAGSTITLTATKTYYHSSAGNDTVDLPAKLQALLDAASGALNVAYTVTIDASEEGTGQYTISAIYDNGDGSANDPLEFTITWVSTALRNILGWTGNLATGGGTSSYTSQGSAEGLWLPDCAPLSLTSIGDEVEESDQSVLEAPTGTYVHRIVHHRKQVITDLRYPQLTRRKARIVGETYANESWQQFWRDVIDGDASAYLAMGQVRIYPDAGVDGTYYDYWVGAGLSECRPTALREGWQGVFGISISRLILVE